MSLSKNLGTYTDVKNRLDLALRTNGGRLEFLTKKEAYRFRARAYMFRALLYKASIDRNSRFGLPPSTPYDGMILTVTNTGLLFTFNPLPTKFVPNEPDTGIPTQPLDELEVSVSDLMNELDGGKS